MQLVFRAQLFPGPKRSVDSNYLFIHLFGLNAFPGIIFYAKIK